MAVARASPDACAARTILVGLYYTGHRRKREAPAAGIAGLGDGAVAGGGAGRTRANRKRDGDGDQITRSAAEVCRRAGGAHALYWQVGAVGGWRLSRCRRAPPSI